MSALPVVQQILNVAKHSPAMARDSACISGLLLFLDNHDPLVVLTALNALKVLSDHKDNQEYMAKIFGLVSSVQTVRGKNVSDAITAECSAVLNNLCAAASATPSTTATTASTAPTAPLPSAPSTPKTQATTASTHSTFQNKLMKNARTLTIQVSNMTDLKSRQEVEQILIRVKGVVSFTFDPKLARVIVRARNELTPETICQAINDSKVMTAQQVVRNEQGQEVLVGAETGKTAAPSTPSGASAGARKGGYLDDVEAPAEKSDKAVARKDDASFVGSSWISSVGGYLARSLYW